MVNLNELYINRAAEGLGFWSAVRSQVLYWVRGDEDVAQEVLVRVIEALPLYQDRGRFGHWLSTICHRTRLNSIRDGKSNNMIQLNDAIEAPPADSRVLVDTSFLNPSQREIANRLLEGYTFTEIAKEMGISKQAVRKRLRRAGRRTS